MTVYRRAVSFALAASVVLAGAEIALAQDPVRDADAQMYPTDVRYDTRIPTPAEFLGFELGERPVRHHMLVEYIQMVAQMSDRLSVEVIGHSHERRPILFVVATSPANQSRIDDIKSQHVALTEPDIEQAVSPDMPVVTWLNFGVHGAESSGMDASLPTVYYLAAAQGTAVDDFLNNSVVLVTAVFNPDGHSWRAQWLDTWGGQSTISDPQHIQHNYHGQLARTNHYGFDLNRQWISVTQPEPRAWMAKWHEWRPNLSVDMHEMGSDRTYYFSPGIRTRSNPIIPGEAADLLERVVSESESFLDSESRLYFHGERYDNFFLGKGAGFPMVNGGIGMLHEAGSARAIELQTPNGLRTYRENIRKHFRTGLTDALGAFNLRSELLEYQKNFYDTAIDEANDAVVRAYVFDAPRDAARMYHFVELLNFHRIATYDLSRDIVVNGTAFAAGNAMIVPMAQPQFRLVRAMFETLTEFEDPSFYDVSAWTLPLSFNLEYEALSGRNFRANLMGNRTTLSMPVADTPDGPDYAYLFEWDDYYSPRALNRVLSAGLMASVATQPFVATTSRGVQSFQPGSILVPFDRQEKSKDEIAAVMRTIAAEDGVFVHSMTSARSAIGTAGFDLGGPSFKPLKKPEILVVTGRGIDIYNAGEIWHLLDIRMRTAMSMRARDRLGDIDFRKYTHIVFPGGDYEYYMPEYAGRIRQWVSEGGTIIGIRQGAQWVRTNVLDYIEPLPGEELLPVEPETESGHDPMLTENIDPERHNYGNKAALDALEVIGGTIFGGDLDNTHPLGFGYSGRRIALMKNTTEVMVPPVNPFASVITYDTPPVLSGYASAARQEEIGGSAALIAERKDGGSVILFADDPNFRAIWYGSNKLFLNSLYFSKAFEPPIEE